MSLVWTELSRFTSGPLLRRLVPLALLLIPTLYGVLYLWSNWDPFGHMKKVPVAVVNLDQQVTARGQNIDAGKEFVSQLRQDRSLQWEFVDATTAAEGVQSGRFMFSVTVPADFSSRLTSPLTGDPSQASLLIQTNDANGYIASTKIAETAEKELRNKIDGAAFKAYTNGVLDQLMDMHTQLSTAAQGARQLADGSGTAASGAITLATGTSQLATGATQLADGTGQLVTGTGQLASGAGDLAAGAEQLADGAAQVSAGTQELVSVLQEALGAAESEIVHLGQSVSSEIAAAKPLIGAATVVADRIAADAAGLRAKMQSLCPSGPKCEELWRVSQRVEDDTRSMANSLQQLGSRLTAANVLALAHSATQLTDSAAAGTARVLELLREMSLPVDPRLEELNQLAREANTAQHHVEDGLKHLSDLLGDLEARLPGLIARIDAGVAQVELLNSGAGQVAAGAAQLSGGAGQLAGGAAQVASGSTALASGAGQLRDGLRQAEPATQQLASGLATLNKGNVQLADGLASGAAQIPVLDKATQQRAAEVLSDPVRLQTDDLNAAKLYGRGLAPFFFSIALWVFGLIAFQLLRAANPRALSGQTAAPAIAFGAWAPAAILGAGGAAVLYLVTQVGLGLDAVHPWWTAGLMMLGVASFAAIAHLLRLAFGVVGELITLVLLMLQLTSSGGLYPLQTAPAPFRLLHPLLPMTYLVDALRVSISGGLTSHLIRDALVLLAFLLGALALSTLVVMRQRRWTMGRLHPAIEM